VGPSPEKLSATGSGTSIDILPLPSPGLWEGEEDTRAGGPARKIRKRYNLKRYAIITWEIIRFSLTRYLNKAYFYALFMFNLCG